MILGFLLVVIVCFFLFLFIKSLIQADPNITASVIGATSLIGIGIWSHYSTKLLEVNSRHFVEKKNAYMYLINLIFMYFKATKNDEKVDELETIECMFNFKREVMVWGDQEVINALEVYERENILLADKKDPNVSLLIVDDLLRAIRKDLGHNDSHLARGSLVGMFLDVNGRKEMEIFTRNG